MKATQPAAANSLVVIPLEEKHLQRVVQIHRDGLSYTFNSRLGDTHLSFVYSTMIQGNESYVGVALIENQPVGVISGTIDIEITKAKLLKELKLQHIINIFVNLILHPTLFYEWWKGNVIGEKVSYEGIIVQPTLTAIAVDPNFQGTGIGKTLVNQLEDFLKQKGMQYYRLDTLQDNVIANKFYRNLGFQKVEDRADSTIYIKKINYE